MWTTVQLSLCLIHLMARERDSGCCNIDHEAPSCLIGSETLYIHRLRSSAAAFCIFCSCPSTAPCPCTCSPPHTRTLHLTCLCSSESPSGEILGQNKNKNDNRLIITHMKRWQLFQVITETQKCQKTRSNRKNESQFLYLVCSLWSRGYICLPGSARRWNFLKDTPHTLCKTSDTHLAEDSKKAKWAADDSVHVNAGCGYATLSLCRWFFLMKKKGSTTKTTLFSVVSYADSTAIIHSKRWVNALWKTSKSPTYRNIKKERFLTRGTHFTPFAVE